MDNKSDWKYDKIFDQPDGEIVEQKLVTTRRIGKKIEITTVTRKFYGNTDYQDSTETKVL